MNNLLPKRLVAGSATILFLFSVMGSALAQIEEVVVTAQKRVEDIQDVPISITAISGNMIEDSGIDTLQDLGQYVPNLTLSKSSQVANNRIIMRGVGSVGNNAIDPSVAVFIDGIYYPRTASVVGSLNDLEMVEVLRGPQGTLFGRNASMGALNIRTRAPSDEFEGNIRASYGDYDHLKLSGALSGPLMDNVSGRVAVQYSDRDGYGDNAFTTGGSNAEVGAWEDFSLRGKLNFLATDNLDISVIYDYAKVENQGSVVEVNSATTLPAYLGVLSSVLSPSIATVLAGGSAPGPLPNSADTFDYNLNQDHKDFADDEQWGVSLDITYDIGEYTLRSITGYREWENTTFESALRLPADLFNRDTVYETDSLSQEFQLISPLGGAIEYVAGVYYYDEEYTIDQNFDLGPDFCAAATNLVALQTFQGALAAGASPMAAAVAGLTTLGPLGAPSSTATNLGFACSSGPQNNAVDGAFNQDVTSIAAYGQATFNVSDTVRLTGGLRFTDDSKSGTFSQLVPNVSVIALELRVPDVTPGLRFDDSKLTYMGNISWDMTDDIMLFATASSGYKSGGFNSDGGNRVLNRVFGSEEVENWEIGVKSVLWDNKAIANLTFFISEISNFQDRQFDGVNFDVQNVGELTQQGFELDLQLQPTDNLYSVIGVSYLDSEFGSFPNATALPAVVASVQAQNSAINAANQVRAAMMLPLLPLIPPPTQSITGQSNHFSPEWQLSAMAEYSNTIPDMNLGWFIRGEYQYVADQNIGAETNQNPQGIQEGYSIVNARIGIRSADESWELAGFVHNAFDEGYCQTMFNQPIGTTLGLVDATTLGGMQRCVLGNPQTFGVEAAYRF